MRIEFSVLFDDEQNLQLLSSTVCKIIAAFLSKENFHYYRSSSSSSSSSSNRWNGEVYYY